MSRLLIYAQDRGGANVIARVASRLLTCGDVPTPFVVAHPMAEAVFDRLGIAYDKLAAHFDRLPVDADRLGAWLASRSISHVICTTSSRFFDMTNCHLIAAARALGVPTLAYLDHWIGFDRFVDDTGAPKYLTDVMGCIDQYCADELTALGMPPHAVRVVGHPHLEAVRDAVAPVAAVDAVRICLVSQPSMRARSFRGLFDERVGGRPLIESVVAACRGIKSDGRSVEIRYRPHPKETGAPMLPDGVEIDASSGDMHLYERHDLFIGATSMVIIEAAVAGRRTVRLAFPELEDAAPALRLPEPLPVEVSDLSGLSASLQGAVDAMVTGGAVPEFGRAFVTNAQARATALAKEFLR